MCLDSVLANVIFGGNFLYRERFTVGNNREQTVYHFRFLFGIYYDYRLLFFYYFDLLYYLNLFNDCGGTSVLCTYS